jgi:hypothetical protein
MEAMMSGKLDYRFLYWGISYNGIGSWDHLGAGGQKQCMVINSMKNVTMCRNSELVKSYINSWIFLIADLPCLPDTVFCTGYGIALESTIETEQPFFGGQQRRQQVNWENIQLAIYVLAMSIESVWGSCYPSIETSGYR